MYQLLPHLKCELTLAPVAGKIHVMTGENGIGKTSYLNYHYQNFLSGSTCVYSGQKPLEIFFDRPLARFRQILEEDSENFDRDLFQEFWKRSGLSGKENRLLSHLSGGEGQLLKLISQCSAKSELYLIDEPGQYLDREKKNVVSDLLKYLIQKKSSILAIDHDTTWFPEGTTVHELHQIDSVLKERAQWTT